MTYIEDMPERLADAHSSSAAPGASTIAELTAAGRPAILVPLPVATDDHQTANAREIAKPAARAPSRNPISPRSLPADPGLAARCRAGECRRPRHCRTATSPPATSPTWSSGSSRVRTPVLSAG